MRNKDNRLAFRREAPDDREQTIHFLRRQYSSRLVEDQKLRIAVKRLQNFEALLLSDSKLFHAHPRIDFHAVLPRHFGKVPCRFFQIQNGTVAFITEHDVLDDAERRNQHKMLVHHADAKRDRLPRRPDINFFALIIDFALGLRVKTVKHIHQR